MTNPLETISPENKDNLERLNAERMERGLEPLPVESVKGNEPESGGADDWETQLTALIDFEKRLDQIDDLIIEINTLVKDSILYQQDPEYYGERYIWGDYSDELHDMDSEIDYLIYQNLDKVKLSLIDTPCKCVEALRRYGRNKEAREFIVEQLEQVLF